MKVQQRNFEIELLTFNSADVSEVVTGQRKSKYYLNSAVISISTITCYLILISHLTELTLQIA